MKREYAIVQYDHEAWVGCEPGWYWGAIDNLNDEELQLGDTVGPFLTLATAAFDLAANGGDQ